MSVYDFNHHEQIISNNNNNNNFNYNHNHDQNNHSNTVCNNNASNSNGQRARPTELVTSKTAMYVRQRRAMLEQLSCSLCMGYLIDATTIDECMDSFCKSCIIKYLRTHSNCPKCGTLIHETNPLGAIRSDKVLQDIVYKLVPGLYDDEMKRRRDYYRGLIGHSSSSSSDDEGSAGSNDSSSANGINPLYNNEKYGVISHPKQFYKPTDSIDLSIEPHTRADSSTIYYDNRRQSIVTSFTGNIQQQQLLSTYGSLFSIVESQKFKTYLRCPAKFTALQLKKFIAAKYNICRDDTIHLLYLNESLKDVYSLIDIAYIYDWRGIEHMRLFYIIERDLSSTKKLQDSPKNPKIVSRQSVDTSAQTVKRVCIDPNPKYYEVQNANGRSKRLRNDKSTNNNLAKREVGVLVTSSPSPILRSGVGVVLPNRDCDSQTSSTNSSRTVATNTTGVMSGFKSRELVNLGAGAQGARQSQFTDAVSTAIDELSRLRQDAPKETRSLRKTTTCEVGTSVAPSIPKLNISIGSPNRLQQTNSFSKPGLTYSKNEPESSISSYEEGPKDINSNQVVSRNHQIVPQFRQMQATQMLSQPQGSLVTLASFTQAQNTNHIVAVSHSTTTAISSATNDYHQQQSMRSIAPIVSTQQSTINNRPHQLAFSIVTERGITIRRINQDGTSSPSASLVGSYPALPAPESCAASTTTATTTTQSTEARQHQQQQHQQCQYQQQQQQQHQQQQQQHQQHQPQQQQQQQQQQPSASNSANKHPSSVGGSSPRNHSKNAKPVYKLLVDPTKIVKPNFKKLGTARH